ncbi:MAG TPA: NAD(P)H-hydrate epimerase, partial [Acidobacteriaceae bacterium]
MKILTAAEMKACDQATSENFGVPSFTLMQNAAGAVVRFAQSEFPKTRRVVILAGRGNNGGDGVTAARQFFECKSSSQPYDIHLILLGDHSGLKGDAARAWTELIEIAAEPNIHIHILKSTEEFGPLGHLLNNNPATLIVDAVVGTGFQPPLRGLALDALHWLQSTPAPPPVLAVDLPSGWSSDTTESEPGGPVYPADAVVTFTAPKPAHVFSRLTRRLSQPIVVAPIGSPDAAIVSTQNLHWSGSSKTITEPDRPAESNKGMYGHVLLIGGSAGKSGAPAMASLAALRAGAGLVTAAVAPSVLPLVAGIAPELMTQPLAVTPAGEISSDNLNPESLKSLLKGMTVL